MKAPFVKIPDQLCCIVAILAAVALIQACASPTGNLTRYANEQGFVRSKLKTGGYNLLVFENRAQSERQVPAGERKSAAADPARILRVYLEGDGTPWKYRTIIMPDPTPRSPLMLRLMSQEQKTAVYVGRPCYNGTSNEPPCHHALWTSGRYSKAVVQSMASAIRALARSHGADQLWLFGHSGGGALAMLLAAELEQVTRVVTVAGNLDTDAWTDHHNYTRLYSSGNPAKMPVLRQSIAQWHFLGARDQVIPPALVRDAITRQKSARAFLLPGFSHGCCWEEIWPSILEALTKDDPKIVPGRAVKL